MKLDVRIEELFDKPPDAVWVALTDARVLAEWLMPNDFEPRVGLTFHLFPDHETPWEGDVTCEVLELSPPNKMVWSWQTIGMERPTKLVFELTSAGTGTRLRLRHTGAVDDPLAEGLTNGWPERLTLLHRTVGG